MEDASQIPDSESASVMSSLTNLFFGSTVNTVLTVICAYLLYKLLKGSSDSGSPPTEVIKLPPPLSKHNMTLNELRKYDGKGDDGRVCVGILGKVYDVTKGRRFYGPEGPYSTFAGKDATRALATFDVNAVKDEWDDHEGLSSGQMSSVQEWEMQFSERYDLVGKLVKEGEEDDGADDETVQPEKTD
jgi:membrane-associated progesterone receptor component